MDAPPGGPLRDGIAPSLTRSTKTQDRKATSMRDDHVSTDTLLLHAAGMTPPNALAAVDNHLRDCTACASVVERARTVAAVVRAQQALIEESPTSVSAKAENLFARVRPDLTTTAQAADGVIDNVAHEPANEVASAWIGCAASSAASPSTVSARPRSRGCGQPRRGRGTWRISPSLEIWTCRSRPPCAPRRTMRSGT